MEFPQKCAYCSVRQTRDNVDEACPVAASWSDEPIPHEWTNDYSGSSKVEKPSYEKSSPSSSQPIEKPARYNEATTWPGLRTLIGPFAAIRSHQHSDTPPSACTSNFADCGPTPQACNLLCDCEPKALSGLWKKLRGRVLGNIGFTEVFGKQPKYLTHTGLVRAEVILEGDATVLWTFYASAANVCLVGSQVELLVTGKTQSSSGSCHTEQLCMYWLHDELVRLQQRYKIVKVSLRWFTELPMCTLWCVPALGLFIAYWSEQGVVIESDAEKL